MIINGTPIILTINNEQSHLRRRSLTGVVWAEWGGEGLAAGVGGRKGPHAECTVWYGVTLRGA